MFLNKRTDPSFLSHFPKHSIKIFIRIIPVRSSFIKPNVSHVSVKDSVDHNIQSPKHIITVGSKCPSGFVCVLTEAGWEREMFGLGFYIPTPKI